ncbi:hypothetical protein BO70DRAFT_395425 [Aspergillus heteromorphus CBS 117.55]|uniref:Rieske domain-containing protein n=1 Tax=Aspergillus heteromorphus CBS 117.55 TaxID=1448321 RepID=A0A317WFM1_9EURO|nr:uncharacterized protein BO70DRAFT_395425 [Aspergillus heteromorphus CBS 117.55]PWY84745.1 hypothetical protein BO70DRAFT_395425 [Aspergillus heteromorphus CBS 117.55]
MNPFRQRSQGAAAWRRVGRASAFPDLGDDQPDLTPGCKAFTIPPTSCPGPQDPPGPVEAALDRPGDLKDQVLVFKYKGKFHAVDHQCPHSAFPLSQGSLFDIEDFGVVLSAGITCPKHGWSFDLFSGQGDRGNYKLKVWEVQLRDLPAGTADGPDQEVWVRRKQRIG